MPIVGFVGLPGSGKTYFAALAAYNERRWHPKRIIWSNTPLYLPWGEPVPVFDSVEDLMKAPRGSMVVLDEAHLWLNSRNWKRVGDDLNVFLSQLRHIQVDLLFTAQSITSVDKVLRDKVMYCYYMESFRKLGFFYYRAYMEYKKSLEMLYKKGIVLFSIKVARCYDTEYLVKL